MKTVTSLIKTSVLALFALIIGCASTDPQRVEDDFGNSVRHMVDAQIYDREAAANPSTEAVTGMDGVQAEAVMDVYRKHIGDPDKVNESLRIEISE